MRSRRTEKTAIVERQEGDQEAPHSPQRSFATRSTYLSFAQINDNELRPEQGEQPRG